MQLTVHFTAPGRVDVPVDYAHLLQGLIYHQMENPVLRTYLHEQGFTLEKRRFKLFTFSRLTGETVRYDRQKRCLVFEPPLSLTVCSPIPFILQELGTGMLRRGQVRVGSAAVEVRDMSTTAPRAADSPIRVKMLSPLVVYSTLPTAEGRSYTYYYSPFEPRFGEMVGANLAKKHLLVHGSPAQTDRFVIRPLRVEERDMKITRYKDTIIKGWMGEYELRGDPALLQLALDAGLGAKNSQGYGCCSLAE